MEKLRDAINREGRELIRIGSRGPRCPGFIYIGRRDDVNWEELDAETFRDYGRRTRAFGDPLGKNRPPVSDLIDYVPLPDRLVLEAYDSVVDEARIYIVQGMESLCDYSPDLELVLDEGRVRELIEAVYQVSIKDLSLAYRDYLRARSPVVRDKAMDRINAEVNWLHKDVWGALSGDSEGLIREIFQITEEQVAEELTQNKPVAFRQKRTKGEQKYGDYR